MYSSDIKQTLSDNASIYDLSYPELGEIISSWGESRYRTDQIWQGLYQSVWQTPNEFINLPKFLREKLAATFTFTRIKPQKILSSADKQTVKTLFELPDRRSIEAVLMSYTKRNTLCISTQAGCGMGCVFCATGQMGFKRNLTSGEIVEQVLYYARLLKEQGEAVTNIVIMGMGEPFQNYDATMKALECLNSANGMRLGARRFTISTVGLVPAIRRFAAEGRQYNLAVSLHAANDELRSSMLPINKKYPLEELLAACREYVDITRRRITFEWALIQDINDSLDQANQLSARLKGLLCHVNVIPLNPTHRYPGKPTTRERALAFQSVLNQHGIPCTIRLRRGIDIQAGCGQLAIES
jgi:23S rRNA (adenine2503-C2)-methyltransferase